MSSQQPNTNDTSSGKAKKASSKLKEGSKKSKETSGSVKNPKLHRKSQAKPQPQHTQRTQPTTQIYHPPTASAPTQAPLITDKIVKPDNQPLSDTDRQKLLEDSDFLAELFKSLDSVSTRAKLMPISPNISKAVFKFCHTIGIDQQLAPCWVWDAYRAQKANSPDLAECKNTFVTQILPHLDRLYLLFGRAWIHFLRLIEATISSGVEFPSKKAVLHFAPLEHWDNDHPLLKDQTLKSQFDGEAELIKSVLTNFGEKLEELVIYNGRHLPLDCVLFMADFIGAHASTLKSLTLESIAPLELPRLMPLDSLEKGVFVIRTPHCFNEFHKNIFPALSVNRLRRLEFNIRLPEVELNALPSWISRFINLTHLSIILTQGSMMLHCDEKYFRELEKNINDLSRAVQRLKSLKVLKINVQSNDSIDPQMRPQGFPEVVSKLLENAPANVRKLYFVIPKSLFPLKSFSFNPSFPVDTMVIDCGFNETMRLIDWSTNNLFDPNKQKPLPSLRKLAFRELHAITPIMFADIRKCFPNLERLEFELRNEKVLVGEQIIDKQFVNEIIEMIEDLPNFTTLSITGKTIHFAGRQYGSVVPDWIVCSKLIKAFQELSQKNLNKLYTLRIGIEDLIVRAQDNENWKDLLFALNCAKYPNVYKNLQIF